MTEPTMRLTDRLRGRYVIPVNDGAGLLNGSNTFVREFETPPIQHEAAARIDELTVALTRIRDATPNNTNSATAKEMASWTYAVAATALDDSEVVAANQNSTGEA